MREPAKTFEDLVVWQKARQFLILVRDLVYGDVSELRTVLSEGSCGVEVGKLSVGSFGLEAYSQAILNSDS